MAVNQLLDIGEELEQLPINTAIIDRDSLLVAMDAPKRHRRKYAVRKEDLEYTYFSTDQLDNIRLVSRDHEALQWFQSIKMLKCSGEQEAVDKVLKQKLYLRYINYYRLFIFSPVKWVCRSTTTVKRI